MVNHGAIFLTYPGAGAQDSGGMTACGALPTAAPVPVESERQLRAEVRAAGPRSRRCWGWAGAVWQAACPA